MNEWMNEWMNECMNETTFYWFFSLGPRSNPSPSPPPFWVGSPFPKLCLKSLVPVSMTLHPLVFWLFPFWITPWLPTLMILSNPWTNFFYHYQIWTFLCAYRFRVCAWAECLSWVLRRSRLQPQESGWFLWLRSSPLSPATEHFHRLISAQHFCGSESGFKRISVFEPRFGTLIQIFELERQKKQTETNSCFLRSSASPS